MCLIGFYAKGSLQNKKEIVVLKEIRFLENKRAEQVLPRSEGAAGGKVSVGQRGEMAQTMYTHMNKCKNNKIKF
jgi:hypothetical protein